MIPLETLALSPPAEGDLRKQALATLTLLQTRAPGDRRVLALTFFLDATHAAAYRHGRDLLLALVREAFGPEGPPPTSVVAQPPEGARVTLEATVLPRGVADVEVSRRTYAGLPYTVVTGRGGRQVHAGGIASRDHTEDPEAQSTQVFEVMGALLRHEGLTYGQVVRQWNYIEHMLEPGAVGPRDCQRYQVFNDVRTLSYAQSDFPQGYPAATGIGQATGGVQIEYIALEAPTQVEIVALSNPQQVDAHCYSTDVLVGRPALQLPERTPPKFERAKRIAWRGGEVVYVSGTASIVGEQSIGLGDPVAQTRTTLGHIRALLGGAAPSYLRAYVKRAADIPAVRSVCAALVAGTPVTYVQADVCRGELLVEIEGLRVAVSA